MNFTIYNSVRSSAGKLCTREEFYRVSASAPVRDLHKQIAATSDKEVIGELKKKLPVITWQAFFEGKRLAKEARPSGLFMLDIDHVETPFKLWSRIVPLREQLGIVFASMTSSRHGIRLVMRCRPEYRTLEECQRWAAGLIGAEYDSVCKDFARSSFVVPDDYWYFVDAGLFDEAPAEGTVYDVTDYRSRPVEAAGATHPDAPAGDQREGLFGGPDSYKGIPYEKICHEWLVRTGGEPEPGERNVRLHRLATRLRYITDFNAATMLRVMPRYGLGDEEMKSIVHSAINFSKASEIPLDLRETLDGIAREINLADGDGEIPEITTATDVVPSLPPLFRQWFDVSPDDFKTAVTLAQLPILGALGSKLRARYLDGRMHSPSFQVSLEAPQASGKSFLVRLVDFELRNMMQADAAARSLEREYLENVKTIRLANAKVKKQDLPTAPRCIIRYLPPTISITMLLRRMENAQGLHCFALGEEIDTVWRAYKRGFSNLSELLRVSFDNGLYGQDFASENSWSGNVPLYYNVLFSGTPKAMRRFYPDVEDGLVSRVLFVTLPDQFGKPMPVWREFDAKERHICETALTRLSEVSLQGDVVQPDHVMKLDFLNREMERWIKSQQIEAVKSDDRTRDIFCRRSAVVGFRAGMLAWFLWGEKNTPAIRRNTANFAIWVANSMLNQHILRFSVAGASSNINRWEAVYNELGSEFTRRDLVDKLDARKISSPVKNVLYQWRLLGIIEETERGTTGPTGQKTALRFRKIRK